MFKNVFIQSTGMFELLLCSKVPEGEIVPENLFLELPASFGPHLFPGKNFPRILGTGVAVEDSVVGGCVVVISVVLPFDPRLMFKAKQKRTKKSGSSKKILYAVYRSAEISLAEGLMPIL